MGSYNHSLIYGDLGIGKKMPLSLMGEGTAKLLSIMLAIATHKGGIVLIDEIENGVHYSIHPKFWQLIVTLSKRYQCQLFLTTHSYEIIKSLKEQDDDYLSYIRLDRKNGEVLPKKYDAEMLFSAIERDWEIR
jgi:AAA15 family ATPase/GTPase